MQTPLLIGLDLGTTSIKGLLVNHNGEILASALREYNLETKGDICEIDARVYWRASVEVLKELTQKAEGVKEIKALSFSSQAETLIVVDTEGKPLRKAIVWMDNRSVQEAEAIKAHFGQSKLHQLTGQPEIIPMWPATKILWLRKNEPETFAYCHKYLLVEDFIIYNLTGKYVTEPSISSSTLYLDISTKSWWPEMLDYLHVSADQLPDLAQPATPIGNILPSIAKETGLPENTMVVAGAYDHAAGAIGAGNIKEGILSEATGASMGMVVTLEKPMVSPTVSLPCQCHAVPEKYFLLPYGQTAGMVLKWFRDEFCSPESIEAQISSKDIYDLITEQASKISPGAEGLVILPHLMGAGSPEFDPNIKGVFAGVSLGMGKGHFIRAILEAVAVILNNNLKLLNDLGISVEEIRSIGGGSKSALWNQIKSDMTGLPLLTLSNSENASMGAVILAGVGAGVYKNIQDGCHHVVKVKDRYYPNPENKQVYSDVTRKYNELYRSLKGYWE